MASITCPFCTSGEPVDVCGCRWGLVAQRSGIAVARKAFAVSGGRVLVSPRDFQPTVALVKEIRTPPPRERQARQGVQLRNRVEPSRGEDVGDGVALVSAAHPKGPRIGRGRGRLRKAALEIAEIMVDDKFVPWLAAPGRCASCDRRRAANAGAAKKVRQRKQKEDEGHEPG